MVIVVLHTHLTQGDLAAAADDNLATHASWATAGIAGATILAAPDLTLVDSGLPCDTFNVVCRARLAKADAARRIGEVTGYFARAGRPFSWWLCPGNQPHKLGELLAAAGLHRAETELAMAADLDASRLDAPSPAGLLIRRAQTAGGLRDFARVLAAGWSPPDASVTRFYELAASRLLVDDAALALYVGYLEGVAVATAEAAAGGGVVGLYNISTLPAYRRRGIGSAMTRRPLLDARARGYHTAILQATEAGARVYARLGFEPFGTITEYKPAPAGATGD